MSQAKPLLVASQTERRRQHLLQADGEISFELDRCRIDDILTSLYKIRLEPLQPLRFLSG